VTDGRGGEAVGTVTITVKQGDVRSGQMATTGFWARSNGQDLILKLGKTQSGVTLANWLAATYPNLYGKNAGANNLTNKSNADVAKLYVKLFYTPVNSTKVDAQIMAVALAVYTTTDSLGGKTLMANGKTYLADYCGFVHDANGLRGMTYNVGTSGAAFDVANGTTLTINQILEAANRHATNGVLYSNDAALQSLANTLFDGINRLSNRLKEEPTCYSGFQRLHLRKNLPRSAGSGCHLRQ
jgi:hypothetical protein